MEQHNLSLVHLIRKPSVASEKAPLLLMLHGYGSNESDLFSFADEMPGEFFVISARAPLALQPYGHAWYNIFWDNSTGKFSDDEQARKSRDLIANFIEEAISTYNLDDENVTLVGFSQGTILSLAVALSYPEKISNVIGLSGYINPEILKNGYQAKDYSRLSVYSSHGTSDQVIPIAWARKTKPFLDALGIENVYSEYPAGHGVTPQNLAELKDWLQSHL